MGTTSARNSKSDVEYFRIIEYCCQQLNHNESRIKTLPCNNFKLIPALLAAFTKTGIKCPLTETLLRLSLVCSNLCSDCSRQ